MERGKIEKGRGLRDPGDKGKGKREEEGNSSGRIGGRFVFVIE